ncbi:MarR family transcriptional regulator [Siphonobacter sp. BAB-5405]|uniref:bifunctional helix-turn-helix transcriptional regulator/GNAT family N-acetyltransferase n=1 Tax=Siphonobacter sp. BAB-5405 TaxID=1864825 RepID=UPI000C7F8116|nr:bifunctional helix-turn-helix transcriptional regulator/GNAT family N-acetyltransferase [Siphonobacter sp. BAB-5405]PMD90694.1 MarR family transcriptional regulator [Siphonobacter sp. BAB-5405]
MDIISQLGPLAFVSRMRRLAESVNLHARAVYQQYGLDFDPKCFPVFWTLCEVGPLGISELAEYIGFSHPGVIQLAKQLEQDGLIVSGKSDTDKRKRILKLSEKGEALRPEFQKVWTHIQAVNTGLIAERRHNLLWAVEEIEGVLVQQDYLSIYKDYLKTQQLEEVEILDYDPAYAPYFKSLNQAWIEQYFRLEPHDLEQLDHPEEILQKGGVILFARYQQEIVGTVALVQEKPGDFEIVKMAVSPQVQGRQIGKKLGQAILQKAREAGAAQVWLESNTRLVPAIELYKKLGFYKVAMTATPYERADIRMQCDL